MIATQLDQLVSVTASHSKLTAHHNSITSTTETTQQHTST